HTYTHTYTVLPHKSRLLKSKNIRNPDSPDIEICMGKPDTKSGFHNIVCKIHTQCPDFWKIEWENQTKCPDLTHLNGKSKLLVQILQTCEIRNFGKSRRVESQPCPYF
ncbi:unnamed protein product, partial [Meganyctiphanes norvegica]